MKLHANAALSLRQRRRMVLRVLEQGWSIKAAAAAAETEERTCGKWVSRYRASGEAGCWIAARRRSTVANRTDERRIEAIAALRRLRFTGPEIAELLEMALSTVSGILTRIGMGRLGRLGLEPAERYERERPGELIHIDVKKLGRIQGGAGKRVTGGRRNPRRADAIARSRRSGSAGTTCTSPSTTAPGWPTPKCCPTRRPRTAVAFLGRALAFYARHGITVERVMTDNGSRLPLHHPRARLPRAGHPASAHARLPAPDQRQSRALHPHHARRLGLRRDLPRQPRTHRSP